MGQSPIVLPVKFLFICLKLNGEKADRKSMRSAFFVWRIPAFYGRGVSSVRLAHRMAWDQVTWAVMR